MLLQTYVLISLCSYAETISLVQINKKKIKSQYGNISAITSGPSGKF
jgi:hypothetical protein